MKRAFTKTTYLEMRSPRRLRCPPPVAAASVQKIFRPSVEFYRFLYDAVGGAYHWVDRNLLGDELLRQIIHDRQVEIYVLQVEGEPAGFSELDCRDPAQVEIAYFGLLPKFIGRGLGKYFLSRVVDLAWARKPERVWLHTCDLDHPAALPNYLQAGFVVYDEQLVEQVVMKTFTEGR